jgi:hypothetical protein
MLGRVIEYEVRATRFDDHWYVEVPMLSILTRCRSFSDVEGAARGEISRMTRVRPDAFAVFIELQPAWGGAMDRSSAGVSISGHH